MPKLVQIDVKIVAGTAFVRFQPSDFKGVPPRKWVLLDRVINWDNARKSKALEVPTVGRVVRIKSHQIYDRDNQRIRTIGRCGVLVRVQILKRKFYGIVVQGMCSQDFKFWEDAMKNAKNQELEVSLDDLEVVI